MTVKVVRPSERKIGEFPSLPSGYVRADADFKTKGKVLGQIIHGIPTDGWAPGMPGSSLEDMPVELVEYTAGSANDWHIHSEAQTGSLLSGKIRLTLKDGRTFDMDAGSVWYMDANEEYYLSNPFSESAIFSVTRPRSAAFQPTALLVEPGAGGGARALYQEAPATRASSNTDPPDPTTPTPGTTPQG